ncbi:hypothetical protein OSCT_2248 [Oscillochloris trichoides DG-6]|uniref:DUF3696 domain-containing protein n=1 Tax=Oscillochloris trichoides DG-6 TaxID=765420 RepID=E1IFY4_9CHLR|nr:DUF3696 domain-containing protein [Oscillochloris trichoides]EFO79873.1 hypothetical protein OSCT_2248 [Oscillochloris trichoides DG-6]
MLQQIILRHFKCFEQLRLPLAPLTLLSGLNASGKSTVIQSLALLHQTMTENPGSPGLVLNGKDVTLGSADEIVDKISGRDSFTIKIEHSEGTIHWRMQVEANELIAPFAAIQWETEDTRGQLSHEDTRTFLSKPGLPIGLVETLQSLTYISADRIGPRETYQASSSTQQTGVGARGEYTPWFIDTYEDLLIPGAMCHPGATPMLKRQVEAWLDAFFPGSGFEIERLPRTNLLVMRLRTSSATNYHRPVNVGYGLSHVLPVITACLGAVGLAQRDSQVAPLVMIENPELHLHPAGQSAMGVFLARAAATGAQVIIETHSDHILNGIRRAVKGVEGEPILQPDHVAIHFFQSRDDSGKRPQLISPVIDAQGNLDTWPPDFFDQYEKDVGSLIGW